MLNGSNFQFSNIPSHDEISWLQNGDNKFLIEVCCCETAVLVLVVGIYSDGQFHRDRDDFVELYTDFPLVFGELVEVDGETSVVD